MSVPAEATGDLRSAFATFWASPARILVPTLVVSTAGIGVHVLAQYLIGRPFTDSGDREPLGLLLGILALFAVGQLVVAGLYRACLDAVDAHPVRGPFAGWLSVAVVGGAVLAAALLTLNTIFFLVPAIILAFLIRYAPLFILDADLGPLAALVASSRFVIAHLASELWFSVRAFGVLLAGAALLGIGLYVAVPVVLIAQAQRYRGRLQPVG